jgi:hypothetical protein
MGDVQAALEFLRARLANLEERVFTARINLTDLDMTVASYSRVELGRSDESVSVGRDSGARAVDGAANRIRFRRR